MDWRLSIARVHMYCKLLESVVPSELRPLVVISVRFRVSISRAYSGNSTSYNTAEKYTWGPKALELAMRNWIGIARR
jgi:hypothetical protein